MSDVNVIVGGNIKRMRKQRGLTQEHVAQFLGIDQTLVSKMESGQRSVGVSALEKLCSLFFCTLDDLIDEESDTSEKKDFAFRADGLASADLHAIAAIGRIVRNLEDLNALEKVVDRDA